MKFFMLFLLFILNLLCFGQAREEETTSKKAPLFNQKKWAIEDVQQQKEEQYAPIYNVRTSAFHKYSKTTARVVLEGKINLYEHVKSHSLRNARLNPLKGTPLNAVVPKARVLQDLVVNKDSSDAFYGIFSFATFNTHFLPMLADNEVVLRKAKQLNRHNYLEKIYSLIQEYNAN